ncbi:hypothetical protein [Streptomyces sp. SID8352]|uniref:hypothetical protein n=1 Tax=Streptomyces sp. SID8352 TaxID=2690338 RepID=UPI00136E30FC|nr:hypothetical protein [Streptomyces sp. SID8352]MYU22490.1 hypothetical protein [Streptomyces sp. SID8352]
MSSSPRSWRRAGTALRGWRSRQWTVAGLGALTTAALVGVPTAVVPSPLFGRSVPVQWWNYPALAVTSFLAGIVLSTYVRRTSPSPGPVAADSTRLGAVGGVLSFFAVGCPVCNKLVLLFLGTSGALSYWAPLQPLAALLSAGLLAEAALRRLSSQTVCPAAASV